MRAALVSVKGKPSLASQRAAKVWLISFGDLLTLLVGMFIALIAQSKLNPNHPRPPTPQTQEQNQSLQLGAASKEGSGTVIALSKSNPAPARLRFFERDFRAARSELRLAARTRTKKFVNSVAYIGQGVAVEACAVTDSDQDWLKMLERAVELRSQSIDAGIGERGIALRQLGTDCAELRRSGAVAQLRSWKF